MHRISTRYKPFRNSKIEYEANIILIRFEKFSNCTIMIEGLWPFCLTSRIKVYKNIIGSSLFRRIANTMSTNKGLVLESIAK